MARSLIIKDSHYFKFGEIVEGKQTKKGLIIGEHCVAEGSYVILEKLSSNDEEQVRKIVRDLIKRIWWRMYTRSAFLTK